MPRSGGSVADVLCDDRWTGDLRRISMRAWAEDSELAAMVVVRGEDAAGWANLRHVKPCYTRMVWLWVRHAAALRPPVDVLYADEIADLQRLWDEHAQEA